MMPLLRTVLIGIFTILLFNCTLIAAQQSQSTNSASEPWVFVPFKRDGKWGYADAKGNTAIPPEFDEARKFSEGLAAVRIGQKWGFIDDTGQTVIAIEFGAVGDFSEGFAAASPKMPFPGVSDTWGYVNKRGEMVIKPQFKKAFPFSEGLALVSAGGVAIFDSAFKSFQKMGYIDKSGHWVIESRVSYGFFDNFSEGTAPFYAGWSRTWGYINHQGKVFIKPRFGWAGSFKQGLAPVLVDGRCGYIDKTGRVVGEPTIPRSPTGKAPRKKYWWRPDPPPCP